MPGFQHTDLLPLGPDETEYRRLPLPPGTVVEAAGRTFLEIDPTRSPPSSARPSRHPAPVAAVAPRAAPRDRRRSRGVAQRPVRRDRPAAQRLRLGGRRAADVPGHRHRDRHRQAHRDRADRRQRRGGHLPRHLRGLRRAPPALLADGAHLVLGRAQHRHQPARPDRAVRGAGADAEVRVAGAGQGRRLGQQDLPLPGDEGAAEPPTAGGVPRREAALARHRRLPALPPGDRRRRHVGRVHPQDRQAGVCALPRHAAGLGLRARATRSATATSNSRSWSSPASSASAPSSAASTSATTCA